MKIEIKGVIDTGNNEMSNAAWITAFAEWLSLNDWKSEYLLIENNKTKE